VLCSTGRVVYFGESRASHFFFVVSDESIICVCECVLVPGSGSKAHILIIFKTTYTSDLSPHTLVSNFRDTSGHTEKTTPKNATDLGIPIDSGMGLSIRIDKFRVFINKT
jgi:hypothetical protein